MVLGRAHVAALSNLATARTPPKPPARRLPDHVGELWRLAGEQLAELVPEPLVADSEIAKDLRSDRVVVSAQCEQHVLGHLGGTDAELRERCPGEPGVRGERQQ